MTPPMGRDSEPPPKTKKNTATPEKWVDLYSDQLFRYAYSRTLNPELAEDLVQETFLSALHSKSSFKGSSSPKTWLIAILKNKIVDHYRRVSFEQPAAGFPGDTDPIIDLFDQKGKWITEPARWEADPQKLAENGQFWKTIQTCIANFPDRLSHIFTLRILNELTTQEITEIMDITKQNCWVLLHRARLSMKECLNVKWFTKQ